MAELLRISREGGHVDFVALGARGEKMAPMGHGGDSTAPAGPAEPPEPILVTQISGPRFSPPVLKPAGGVSRYKLLLLLPSSWKGPGSNCVSDPERGRVPMGHPSLAPVLGR